MMNIKNGPKIALALTIFLSWCLMIYATRHMIAADTVVSQIPWWNYLDIYGFRGIATIGGDIGGNYTSIWYFIIALFSKVGLYPGLPIEYCIRIISITFTLVSALAVYFIVRHFKGKSSWTPVWGALAILFIPAFFLDILKTNLPDAAYLCLVLLSFLSYLKNKKGLAWFLIGVGMSLKMMAIFFIPFLAFTWIHEFKKANLAQRLAPLWLIAGFLMCSIPGMLAGQSFYSATIEMIFLRTAEITRFSFYSILQGDLERWNVFPIIDLSRDKEIALLGYSIIVIIFSIVFYLLFKIRNEQRIKIGLGYLLILSPLVMFMFMPAQHEGYFALASIFALIVFLVYRTRVTISLFILLTFLMWQAYHGFGSTGGFLQLNDYLFIFIGIIVFLIYKIYQLTTVSLSSKKVRPVSE